MQIIILSLLALTSHASSPAQKWCAEQCSRAPFEKAECWEGCWNYRSLFCTGKNHSRWNPLQIVYESASEAQPFPAIKLTLPTRLGVGAPVSTQELILNEFQMNEEGLKLGARWLSGLTGTFHFEGVRSPTEDTTNENATWSAREFKGTLELQTRDLRLQGKYEIQCQAHYERARF